MGVSADHAGDRQRLTGGLSMNEYDAFIAEVKQRLASTLAIVPEHNLDEKYLASACRDFCESLRALEQARFYEKKGV